MKTMILKNGAELLIRRADEEDAERLADFKKHISGESDFLSYGENEIILSAETERDLIHSTNDAENSVILLAVCGNEIAGFITFHGGARPRKKHAGEMGIAVREKYWGLGIGGMLIDALIEWAKGTKTIRKINLLARSDNENAIRLYEKHGFVKEGLIARDLCVRGAYYDAVSMGLCMD